MRFEPTKIHGVVRVELETITDDRGFFARAWCREEFAAAGLVSDLLQCNISYNTRLGTLRGMHYQADPHGEVKLVRATRGAVYDVALDLRLDSPTYLQWHAEELSADNRRALYIGAGIAHGFITLTDDAELFYQMSTQYVAEASRGVRWNDPAFGIDWPAEPSVISDRDSSYPDFTAGEQA